MFSIAIDGPAGAGKSTVAKMVASELQKKGLNTIYVDTGAIYRAVAYYLLENFSTKDLENQDCVAKIISDINVEIKYFDSVQHVYVNSKDVTDYIRSSIVSEFTSKIAAYEIVRKKLIDIQRDIARSNNVVMDGRDIGTNILKDATLKIFLVASVEVRADRRYKEALQRGEDVDYESIARDIKARDERDESRQTAPTKQASDAIRIDSSTLTIHEVVEKILGLFKYE